jgi:hypothetical protein
MEAMMARMNARGLPWQRELDHQHSRQMFLIISQHKILLCYTFAFKETTEAIRNGRQQRQWIRSALLPYPDNPESIVDIQL